MRYLQTILPALLLLLWTAGQAAGEYELRASSRLLEVTPGTTVFGLLNLEYPEHRSAWNEITAELVRLNPDVFRDGDPAKMRVGTVIALVDVVAPGADETEPAAADAPTAPGTAPAGDAMPQRQAPAAAGVTVVGSVEYVEGTVLAVNPAGVERALRKGASVHRGDIVATDAQARVRLRMTDDTLLFLRAGSRMVIDEYSYKEREPGAGSSVMTLIKGGMRAISGLIGTANPRAVRVNTPVATIGIRGTDYGLRFCEPAECTVPAQSAPFAAGLYSGVLDGTIALRNDAGEYDVERAEFVKTLASDAAPEPAPEAAALVFTEQELDAIREPDEPLGFFAWLRHKIGGTPPP